MCTDFLILWCASFIYCVYKLYRMAEERVQKIIANAGICARRKAEDLIYKGKVKVNGRVITLGDKADLEKDDIRVFNKKLEPVTEKKYILLNKPAGFLVTCDDPRGRKTVFDLLRIREKLIPVGRLDMNTEGLIILTNDGDFANQVIHPRYGVDKTYKVRVDRNLNPQVINKIKNGFMLDDGYRTRPAKVSKFSQTLLEVTLHEGKNRIIKRMMESLGYRVVELERVRIGRVGIGKLRRGKFRNLTETEKAGLLKNSLA